VPRHLNSLTALITTPLFMNGAAIMHDNCG
jgi:hypothetical protein